jgi:DNA-binding MarR family transcriptional regulator
VVQTTQLGCHDGGRPGLAASLWRAVRALKRCSSGGVLDMPALGVLHQLDSAGPIRLSDLATTVGLDASTVSRHVRSLEDAGCVARTPDPADRRAAHLDLTPEGRDILRQAVDRREEALATALRGWSDADRRTLESLLQRLAHDLEATNSPERTR